MKKKKSCHFSLCKKISWRRNGKCKLRNIKKVSNQKRMGEREDGSWKETKKKSLKTESKRTIHFHSTISQCAYSMQMSSFWLPGYRTESKQIIRYHEENGADAGRSLKRVEDDMTIPKMGFFFIGI